MKNLLKTLCILFLNTGVHINAESPWLLSAGKGEWQSLDLGALSYSFEKSTNLSQKESSLIDHVKQSVANAWVGISHIQESTQRQIDGKSTSRIKHLLSNLCTMPNTKYLEIGLWTGSTFVAALCNNQSTINTACGIDNWSEGGKSEFEKNCETFLPKKDYNYTIISQDCFTLNPQRTITSPINVCFYSGSSTRENQEKAFVQYDSIFDNAFIVAIDNWEEESVRTGTALAFRKLGYEILFEIDLPAHKKALWWNGLYIAVIRKPA